MQVRAVFISNLFSLLAMSFLPGWTLAQTSFTPNPLTIDQAYCVAYPLAAAWNSNAVPAQFVGDNSDNQLRSRTWTIWFNQPQSDYRYASTLPIIVQDGIPTVGSVFQIGRASGPFPKIITGLKALAQLRSVPGYGNVQVLSSEAIYGPDGQTWYWGLHTTIGVISMKASTPGDTTPKDCFGENAAALSPSLVRDPIITYITDGKGWDWEKGLFANSDDIQNGYHYLWSNPTLSNPGTDCSGLVFWSYNKAFGASVYIPCTNQNPVEWDGADQQYQYNFQQVVNGSNDLKPGDLLFFNYGDAVPGHADHVAMYVGAAPGFTEGAVTEAYVGVGLISSSCSALGCVRATTDPVYPNQRFTFLGFRRRTHPIKNVRFCSHSPVDLMVTDPDGFRITPQTLIVTTREQLREITGTLYYSEWQIGSDGRTDAMVRAPVLKTGDYVVQVVPKTGTLPTETYSLDFLTADTTVNLAHNIPIGAIPPLGYGVTVLGGTIIPFDPVGIDIQPGGYPNTIKLSKKGTIPVAILSSGSFNAVMGMDKTSLTFGHTGSESSLAFCDSTGEDVNGDRLPDLVCHFYVQKTGFQTSDTQGVLKGRTLDGTPIKGADSISVVF